MEYLFVIFGFGFLVTLVVAKGILQAHQFVAEETQKQLKPPSGGLERK
jgi:hypothetical protein